VPVGEGAKLRLEEGLDLLTTLRDVPVGDHVQLPARREAGGEVSGVVAVPGPEDGPPGPRPVRAWNPPVMGGST
jgi:hypothetical protein